MSCHESDNVWDGPEKNAIQSVSDAEVFTDRQHMLRLRHSQDRDGFGIFAIRLIPQVEQV
jgi:hypothetical protein